MHYSVNPHFGLDELAEEAKSVKKQELITPGRRGEQIKYEEISKEIVRRLSRAFAEHSTVINLLE